MWQCDAKRNGQLDTAHRPARRARGVVRASGDLTGSTRLTEFFRALQSQLDSEPGRLVLDLTAVEAADTKLVACLVAARRHALRTDVRLELRLSPPVMNWLKICRLHNTFDQLLVRSTPGDSSRFNCASCVSA